MTLIFTSHNKSVKNGLGGMQIVRKSTPQGMQIVITRYANCHKNMLLLTVNQIVTDPYKDTIIYPLKDIQIFKHF